MKRREFLQVAGTGAMLGPASLLAVPEQPAAVADAAVESVEMTP